jgi:hypothetical protein
MYKYLTIKGRFESCVETGSSGGGGGNYTIRLIGNIANAISLWESQILLSESENTTFEKTLQIEMVEY